MVLTGVGRRHKREKEDSGAEANMTMYHRRDGHCSWSDHLASKDREKADQKGAGVACPDSVTRASDARSSVVRVEEHQCKQTEDDSKQ
jgi:hypothetical protein